jgi:corrinoid protein of di/trimethylamine methyltransferase
MFKNEILEKLKESVINGDIESAKKAAEDALKAGMDPLECIENSLRVGMMVVGEKFQRLEIFLPDLINAGEAMKAATAILLSQISRDKLAKSQMGRVVIGTSFGDIHDIGKNIVAALLTAAGFTVYDLGVDVPPLTFIEKAEEVKADIIAISSLLSVSMHCQKDVIDHLKKLGIRSKYYVVIGGGCVTPEWAKEIGADGYGRTALDAVEVCKVLVTERPPPPLKEPIIRE